MKTGFHHSVNVIINRYSWALLLGALVMLQLSVQLPIFWPLVLLSLCFQLLLLAKSTELGWGSIGVFFVALSAIFHLGLLPYLWLGINDSYGFAKYHSTWLSEASSRSASIVVINYISSFAIGYFATSEIARRQSIKTSRAIPEVLVKVKFSAPGNSSKVVGLIGVALTLAGSFIIFLNYTLLQGYEVFLTCSDLARGSWGPFLVLGGIGVGISSKIRSLSITSFAVGGFALTLMALSGSRMFLSIAVLIAILVSAKSYNLRIQLKWWLLTFLLLIGVSYFRTLRDDSLNGLTTLNPLNGLYELGGSLRPLVEIIRIKDKDIFEFNFEHVPTLFIWLSNKIYEIFGISETRYLYGEGVSLLSSRFGEEYRFGYTLITDLYFDFPPIIAFALFFLVGVLISRVDSFGCNSIYGGLITTTVSIPLFFSLRQPGSLIVPHTILIGALCAFAVLGQKLSETMIQGDKRRGEICNQD